MTNCLLLAVFFFFILCGHGSSSKSSPKKLCLGTSNAAASSLPTSLERYANCSIVSGNLEIAWLNNLALEYLQEVTEVTGYVLIFHADVKRIALPKLRLIRGKNLYRNEFALYVGENSALNSLELPALGEILNGNVGVYNNRNLCHLDSINWDEIIANPKIAGYRQGYNLTKSAGPRRNCNQHAGQQCHRSCEQRACWAEGPQNCQRFTRLGCSDSCDKLGLRCFGPNSHQCCHAQCSVGCTGPRRTDCLACKHFDDDGTCKPKCPRRHKLNQTTNTREENPNGKYTYVSTCVKNCPVNLFRDNDACVHSCPPKKYALKGECVWCEGVCPKICPGSDEVDSSNIADYENCTIIDGSIGVLLDKIPHDKQLEVFSTLNKITGYLRVEGAHEVHKDLSSFRNLEVIGGQALIGEHNSSLYIAGTSLTALGLKSLRTIEAGNVYVVDNKNLCYADTINWDRMRAPGSSGGPIESLLSGNRNGTDCRHLICDEQCSEEGCWGPGPHHCRSCKNFALKGICVKDCKAHGAYEADEKNCKKCHKDCQGTCTGPKIEDCVYPPVASKAQCQKIIDTCSKL